MTVARVAITGYMHEVNALAAPVTRHDGTRVGGPSGALADSWEAGRAMAHLRALRRVDLVELPVWEFGASGPLRDADFAAVVDETCAALRVAGPVDGVLVFGHGAGRTETDLDSDATYLRALREVIGASVPMVAVLDFHANVSPAMCDLADVLVGYRTNPHVDVEDCAVEAVEHLHRLMNGAGTVVAMSRPPLLLPQLAQNTTPGEPLAAVRTIADELCVPPIRNVSVFGGFSLGDVPDCGLTVAVTADADAPDLAREVATAVARNAWDRRLDYRTSITSVDDAVSIARSAAGHDRTPVLLADTSDNPGGGAPGNSTFLLAALHDAGVGDVMMGLHCDPDVVAEAWRAGVGASVNVTFNAGSTAPLAQELTLRATVLDLVEGPFVPTTGVYRGLARRPGRCCALDADGIRIAVSSSRVQCADADTLLHLGLDPTDARVVVVKSRGHFRAGFAHLFDDAQIVEVGAPGVAPAVLDGLTFANVARPVFPLDPDAQWDPTATIHRARVGS